MQRVILERVLRTDFRNKMTLIFRLRLGRSKLRQPCELLGGETPGRGSTKCKGFEEGKTVECSRSRTGVRAAGA